MTSTEHKPGRPLGVSLAIIGSVLVFSLVPLLQVGMILLVEQHFSGMEPRVPIEGQEQPIEPVTGGDFRGGISDERLLLQSALGIGFLIIGIIAWRGKPSWMRFVFMGAVLVLAAVTLALTVIPQFLQDNPVMISGGSLDVLSVPVLCGQIFSVLLVPLYVVWYLNRGPARAFYRGYYLSENGNPSLE